MKNGSESIMDIQWKENLFLDGDVTSFSFNGYNFNIPRRWGGKSIPSRKRHEPLKKGNG